VRENDDENEWSASLIYKENPSTPKVTIMKSHVSLSGANPLDFPLQMINMQKKYKNGHTCVVTSCPQWARRASPRPCVRCKGGGSMLHPKKKNKKRRRSQR
jgi:hypothetical protein